MPNSLFVLLVSFLILTAGACASIDTVSSKEISPQTVFQSYTISGDASRQTVNAVFRVGGRTGTTIALTAPSGIEHNGAPLEVSSPNFMKGTTYFTEPQVFTTSHHFVYTDAKGNKHLSSVNFAPLEVSNAKVLSRTKNSSITLSRNIGDDEKISLAVEKEHQTLANGELGADEALIFNGRSKTLTIAPAFLRGLKKGLVRLQVRTTKTMPLTNTDGIGGEIVVLYDAKPLIVRIL